jgi:NADH-quinone oxidoreductase subunit J
VHSVLFLILAFFEAAGLFILIGAEFIAMTLIIVYVGAVAVLFLFVVMMLDIKLAEVKQGFLTYAPLSMGIVFILLVDLLLAIGSSLNHNSNIAYKVVAQAATNTHSIGHVLYTHYIYPFQLAGIVLFIAMVSCIVLTLRKRPGVKKQNVAKQLSRDPNAAITLVKVKTGEGVDEFIR